jgi:hypothetical protein
MEASFSFGDLLRKRKLNSWWYLIRLKEFGDETLTIVYANPDNDMGSPEEVTTKYNTDPSWYSEITEFVDCVIDNKKITSGTSDDALQTMALVYKIYYQDKKWSQTYNISDPDDL